MRYFDISVVPASGGAPLQHWTSHPNGITSPPDPGAPLVEFDLIQSAMHLPGGDSYFRVWGISLQTASAASTLNSTVVTIRGGMGKGLPLANPQEAGVLITGTLYQCLANWVGTSMTLDGYVIGVQTAAQATAASQNETIPPANIVINWPANTQLSTAIKSALSIAYPSFTVNVNISPNIVISSTEQGAYKTLAQFAEWINSRSQYIIGGSYSGVMISANSGVISVFDATSTNKTTKAIQFNDMIGQVTWVEPQTVHVPMVMRGDLAIGDIITMPPGQVTTTASSLSQFRQSAAIKGKFMINKIRHVGNSRAPDGHAWTTSVFATVYSS